MAEEISVPKKFANFLDVFSKKLVAVLPYCSDINEYIINLEPNKKLSYGLIYSLGPIELTTLKTYIEANLANGFIRPSKSLVRAPILFV